MVNLCVLNPLEINLVFVLWIFYYFNNEGKIIKDIVAEGMIGILRVIGIFK